jgi:hypothetical protein
VGAPPLRDLGDDRQIRDEFATASKIARERDLPQFRM